MLTETIEHLSGIFRYLLPGILVVAGARLAYPCWFRQGIDLKSWQHLFVLGTIFIAVGNAWFALNRYGVHQFIDYVLYLCKVNGPARGKKFFAYLDDLGSYTYQSLHYPDTDTRVRQHIAFRASTVLLILTVGELLLTFGCFHASDSPFVGYGYWMVGGGLLALVIGIWQMVITRRIDYCVLNPPDRKA